MAWVEKVKLNTQPLACPEDSLLGDAPLAELSAYFDELLADDQKVQQLGASLSDLARKLPSDVLKELETPQYLRSLLEQARPMLLDRLMGK